MSFIVNRPENEPSLRIDPDGEQRPQPALYVGNAAIGGATIADAGCSIEHRKLPTSVDLAENTKLRRRRDP